MAVTARIVQWRGPATRQNKSKHNSSEKRERQAYSLRLPAKAEAKVNAEGHFSFSRWLAGANQNKKENRMISKKISVTKKSKRE